MKQGPILRFVRVDDHGGYTYVVGKDDGDGGWSRRYIRVCSGPGQVISLRPVRER